jgi:hypothetical protein
MHESLSLPSSAPVGASNIVIEVHNLRFIAVTCVYRYTSAFPYLSLSTIDVDIEKSSCCTAHIAMTLRIQIEGAKIFIVSTNERERYAHQRP